MTRLLVDYSRSGTSILGCQHVRFLNTNTAVPQNRVQGPTLVNPSSTAWTLSQPPTITSFAQFSTHQRHAAPTPPHSIMTVEPTARISFDQYAAYAQSYLAQRDRVLRSHASSAHTGGQLSWLTYATGWEWLEPMRHARSGMVFEQAAGLDRSFGVVVRNPPSSGVEETAGSGSTTSIDEQQEQQPGWEESPEVKQWEVVTVHQTISYSATWRVPVLWFHAHRANGEPISSDDLLRLRIVFPSGTLPPHNDQQEPPPPPPPPHHLSQSSRGSLDAPKATTHRIPPHIVDVPDTQLSSPPTASQQQATVGGVSIADHPRTRLPSFYLHPCNTHAALQALLPESTAHCKDTLQKRKEEEEEEEDDGSRYICAFINVCAGAVEMRAG